MHDVEEKIYAIIETFPSEERDMLHRALSLSKKVHATQIRHEGVPHFVHAMRIAISLYEILGLRDADMLAAALLHDTVEDTDVTIEEIEETFSAHVAYIVDALTRDEGQSKQEKFLHTLDAPWEVRAIKACDWLDNMRSWFTIPEGHPARDKITKWMIEAETMYIPLARTVDDTIVALMKEELARAYTAQDGNE